MSRKIREGYVVSDKMQKTVVVLEKQSKNHPLYGKKVTKFKKYMVDNPGDEAKMGDRLRIAESNKPLSKNKRWVILEILERGNS